MKALLLVVLLTFIAGSFFVKSSDTSNRAVLIKVTVNETVNPSVRLDWPADTNAIKYLVRKKLKGEEKWTIPDTLQPEETTFTDKNITLGIGYEYSVEKWTNDYDGFGYVYAGIGLPPAEFRGKVLVLIDSTIIEPLQFEINRFIRDLEGEGWIVITRPAPRTENFSPEAVKYTKSIIVEEFRRDSLLLKSLILLGRIAVPYSGAWAIDGHSWDHSGAWAADAYYSVIDGEWTDYSVNNDSVKRNENINVANDGKFDQVAIPGLSRLQTGRIDMYNLPDFEVGETELIRRYLDKNHKYRNKEFTARQRALIDDGFGMYSPEAYAATAWMNFAALVGPDSIDEGSFRYDLREKGYIWAYGCNSGSFISVHNTAYTSEFDSLPYHGVFTALFGSYNGDYDSRNNLLRASIASNPSILTCAWTGKPFWYLHHMALGEPIGYSTMLVQNNKTLYLSTGIHGLKGPHVALFGDPTLRMHIIAPPANLKIETSIDKDYNRKAVLQWEHSKDEILGYNIYRAEYPGQIFTKINEEPVKDSVFTDEHPFLLSNYYKVRAIRLEKSATGSYYNLSGSAFGSTNFNKDTNTVYCRILPNPVTDILHIYLDLPVKSLVTAEIYNSTGAKLRSIDWGMINSGVSRLDWNLTDRFGAVVSSGVYFISIKTGAISKTEKIVIAR